MTAQTLAKFSISTLHKDAFNLHSVVTSPRSVSPADLESACANVNIDWLDDYLPPHAAVFLEFLFRTFFRQAHRTGLYNRQKELWEAIARVDHGHLDRVLSGWIFASKEEPMSDLVLLDRNERPLIIARLVDPEREGELDERTCVQHLNTFLKKVSKLQMTRGTLAGCFVCFPGTRRDEVLKKIEEIVGADDPIGKYEAQLPPPSSIPIDFLAYNEDFSGVDLVFPQLPRWN